MRKVSRAVVKAPRYWAMTRVTTLSQPWPLGWRVPRRRDTWSMASVERDSYLTPPTVTTGFRWPPDLPAMQLPRK